MMLNLKTDAGFWWWSGNPEPIIGYSQYYFSLFVKGNPTSEIDSEFTSLFRYPIINFQYILIFCYLLEKLDIS